MNRTFSILVIEDDAALQLMMRTALSDAGYHVECVGTKAGAVAMLTARHHFELILLDLNLGPDRGEDIFLYLIALEIKYPPVIIISAQPTGAIQSAAEKICAAASLQKPISVDELLGVVRQTVA